MTKGGCHAESSCRRVEQAVRERWRNAEPRLDLMVDAEVDDVMSVALSGSVGWAYVAGFFDGEGHLRPARSAALVLTQSERPVLDAIAEFLISHNIRCAIYSTKRPRAQVTWKPMVFHLYVTRSADIVAIIHHIRPWLIVKKQVAEDYWRYAKLYPSTLYRDRKFCRNGHPLSGSNLGKTKRQRACLTCKRINSAKYRRTA